MIGLNNKKIGFIVDSSSNLKDGQFDDVKVVPLGVTIQNGSDIKTFKDGIDFHENDLANALNSKETSIKTSQASMPDMFKIAQEMCSKYDQVFVFPIHKNLSGNINSWRMVKDDFPNLNVVMTCDIGYSFAWTIDEVKNFLKSNEATEANVQKFVDEKVIPNRVGFLMVEDLEQLKKGGRVSGIKAAIAKLFKIKPVILFDQNGLTNFDKVKEYEELFQILDKQIAEKYKNKKIVKSIVFVPFGDEQTKQNYLNAYTKHYGQIPYDLVSFPTIVVSHTGLKHVAIYVELM
ncbi:MAG: DegV family EDD domain-containing protein [Mycoplasma sp.]|nr:DegV family EDD domain-containing protein [Candidatus Hennigella equi]